MADTTETQALDLMGAAGLLESLLPDEDTSATEPEAPAEEAAADAPEGHEEADTPAEPDPETPEDEEGETPEEEEEQPAVDPEQEVVFEDEDGKPVTRAEARKRGLRQADYTRKTQEAAELRKQAEAERSQAAAERARYIAELKQYEAAMKELVPQEPNWDEIRTKYPDQFAAVHAEWTLHQQKLADAVSKRQAAEKKQAEEGQKQYAEYLRGEQAKLVEALPVLKDPVKGKAEMQRAFEYGQSVGFKPEELMSVGDSRALLLLWKAMQYDAGKAKQIPAKKIAPPVKKVTPGLKPGTAPSGSTKPGQTKAQEAIKRARNSGSVDDAAGALFHLLPD